MNLVTSPSFYGKNMTDALVSKLPLCLFVGLFPICPCLSCTGVSRTRPSTPYAALPVLSREKVSVSSTCWQYFGLMTGTVPSQFLDFTLMTASTLKCTGGRKKKKKVDCGQSSKPGDTVPFCSSRVRLAVCYASRSVDMSTVCFEPLYCFV